MSAADSRKFTTHVQKKTSITAVPTISNRVHTNTTSPQTCNVPCPECGTQVSLTLSFVRAPSLALSLARVLPPTPLNLQYNATGAKFLVHCFLFLSGRRGRRGRGWASRVVKGEEEEEEEEYEREEKEEMIYPR